MSSAGAAAGARAARKILPEVFRFRSGKRPTDD